MNQQKNSVIADRVRAFRGQARLSQEELGERLGVSGNYISMIELGKKAPGPSLRKLFESLEQSPAYRRNPEGVAELRDAAAPRPTETGRAGANALLALLSTETLIQTFGDVADKLVRGDGHERKRAVGSLREMLDEIERRLVASSGGLSEAQEMAMRAAQPDATRGTK